MGKKINFDKAIITVDTSDAVAKELEFKIKYNKMTLEEKKALAYAEQAEWDKEMGLK